MDWKRSFTSLLEICKNFLWESQFLSFGEIALTWILTWKWSLIITSFLGSLLFLAINIILVGILPVSEGEYRFRDILSTSKGYKWKTFSRSQSDHWKSYIISYRHPYTDNDDELGSYEITAASVFKHSLGNNRDTPVIGPIDNRIVTLLCQKKGRANMYLTFEKGFGVPELSLLTIFFGAAKKSGIYVQLSGSRDDALTAMKDDTRPRLDVGTRRWRRRKGSKVSVERMMMYYTQSSEDLSPNYHIYSSNSNHFVEAVINILKQMQDDDLGNDLKSASDDSSFLHTLFHMIIRFVVQLVI